MATLRGRRVGSLGSFARRVAIVIALLLLVVSGLGVQATGVLDIRVLVVLVPALAVIARALMVAVVVDGSRVLVRSWFRTIRIPRDSVAEVLTKSYSGVYNRWAEGDALGRRVRMLGIAHLTGGEAYFPATAAWSRKADEAAQRLARELNVNFSAVD